MSNKNIESNLKKLLRGKKACMPGKYLKVPYHGSSEKLRPGKGTPLGQGMYGKVYRGSINDNGRRYVAYKEIDTSLNSEGTSDFEFKVAQKLKKYAVPKMYLYKKCEDEKMNILYMERLEGDDFNKWWKTEPTLEAIKSVITQVVYNLYQISKDIPGFRHQDLHGGNVVVSKDVKVPFSWKVGNKTYTIPNGGVDAVMIDFGLAHFPRMTNPTLKNGGYKRVGIPDKGPAHPLYDLHLFLYTIFAKVRYPQDREERLVHNFIKKLIPNTDFLTFNGPYTTMGRISTRNEGGGLKDSVKRSGERKWLLEVNKSVPTLEDVLTHPFLTGESQVKSILKKIPKAKTPPKSRHPNVRLRINRTRSREPRLY
jgi:tRNA A-37 threonylcarbamoyl transferase component Bud32